MKEKTIKERGINMLETKKENKGITLIALVITIIVLLILAGVSIAMLTGENGILTQANNAKVEQAHASVREAMSIAYNEWRIEVETSSNTKLASTETVTIQGKEEKAKAGTTETFFEYLTSTERQYVDATTRIINVEKLTGGKQPLGNGTGDNDVYKFIEEGNTYKVVYYQTADDTIEISTIPIEITEGDIGEEELDPSSPFYYTQADIDETLKYFTWEMVDVTEENREEYGYDESMVGKRVAVIYGLTDDYYEDDTTGFGFRNYVPLEKIVIPKTIEDSDYVEIGMFGNKKTQCLSKVKIIIYLNDLGVFEFNNNIYSIDVENIKFSGNIDLNMSKYVNLKRVELPENITLIEDGTFAGCESLVDINIPDSVTSIGSGAFYGCTSLTTINIPESVTSIGGYAFDGCDNLTITVEEVSPLTIDDFEGTGIDLERVIFE